MEIVRCGIPKCTNYFDAEEGTQVLHNDKKIWICESCDDGTFKQVTKNVGVRRETKSIEKIKRKQQYEDD